MRSKVMCWFAVVIVFAIPNTNAKRHGSRLVESLIENLEHEEWRDDEESCRDAIFSLLHGVKNQTTWATWIWDSMQLPSGVLYGSRYQLGSFEQCLEDPWLKQAMQYCLVDVRLTEDTRAHVQVDPSGSVEEFVGTRSKHGNRRLNIYSSGVCLPAVCAPSSVEKVSRHIHQLSHLPFGDVAVDPRNCQVKGSQPEYSTGFYAFWLIIFTTTVIVIAVHHLEGSTKNPSLLKLASWFSPSRNYASLTRRSQDELMSLNGLRVICTGTTVVMHYYLSVISLAITNPVDVAKSIDTTPGRFVIQLALFIDAFFLMSGLLLMTGLMARRSGLVEMIFKRYFRLIVPLALCLLYLTNVLNTSGPLQPLLMADQVDVCSEHWWKPLLLINNFIRPDVLCPYHSWYLSCDFQLTIFGITIFWLCQKWSRPTVVRFCAAVFLTSMIIPAVLTYWYELPAILGYDIDLATLISENRVLQTTYMKPYSRASAYLVGLGLGYAMHVYKPKDYRKIIPKTWSICGGILGLLLVFGIMGVGGSLNLMKYNVLTTSLYMAFDRTIFVIGLCLVIIVIEYGTFPLVGDLLTSKVFLPMSHLTYGIYMYHPLLLWQNLYSMRTPLAYDFFHLFVNGFGYIVVVCTISYLLWFIIESPATNITNSLFSNRKIKIKPVNEIDNNGTSKTIKQL